MTASLRASLERLRQWAQLKNMCQCESCSQRRNDLRAALEAIEQDGWVSVKTKMPELREEVLVWDGTDMWQTYLRQGGWDSDDGVILDESAISHWRPLPDPPTPPSQEDGQP